jgi:hypothetical protein
MAHPIPGAEQVHPAADAEMRAAATYYEERVVGHLPGTAPSIPLGHRVE